MDPVALGRLESRSVLVGPEHPARQRALADRGRPAHLADLGCLVSLDCQCLPDRPLHLAGLVALAALHRPEALRPLVGPVDHEVLGLLDRLLSLADP